MRELRKSKDRFDINYRLRSSFKPSPLCRKPITYLETMADWDALNDTVRVSSVFTDVKHSPASAERHALLPTVQAQLLPYFTCNLCGAADFQSLSAYFSHLWHDHSHLQAVGGRVHRVPIRLRPQLFVTCSLCGVHNSGSAGETADQLSVSHVPIHAALLARHGPDSTTAWLCDECDHVCDNRGALALHCLDSEHVCSAYTCRVCLHEVEGVQNYIAHLGRHYLSAMFRCFFCQTALSSESACVAHIKRYHAADYSVHRCGRCGYRTALLHDFVQHVRGHTQLNRLTCERCGAIFQSKKSLVDHARTHETAQFVCETCDRVFSHPQTLRRHQLNTHGRPEECVCAECGRQFASVYSMKRHKAVHTGERPHQCEKCGRAYLQRNDLKLHVKRCKYVSPVDSEPPATMLQSLFH